MSKIASSTRSIKADEIKEGGFMMILDDPWVVISINKINSKLHHKDKIFVWGESIKRGNEIKMEFDSDDILEEPLGDIEFS